MTPLLINLCWLGAAIVGAMILGHLLSIGAFNFKLKKQPPAVRVDDSWLIDPKREALKAAAMPDLYRARNVIKADFNRNFK